MRSSGWGDRHAACMLWGVWWREVWWWAMALWGGAVWPCVRYRAVLSIVDMGIG